MNILIYIYKIIRAFTRKIKEDNITAYSAQASFFVLISFFPFFMLLLTLVQYLPITRETLEITIVHIFPQNINSLVLSIVGEIYAAESLTLISLTVISALWSSSKGILGIVKGLNCAYGIKESRNYFKLRFISVIYTFIFAIMLIVSLLILVFGNRLSIWIISRAPILSDLALIIISIRTIVGLIILILFFLLIYTVIPNRPTKFYKELPGALISAAGWMGFSYLFSFYIDNMSNYSNTYGSLTAIVLFMLWFYVIMNILFIGGEINVILNSGDLLYYIKYMFKHRKELKHYYKNHEEVKVNNLVTQEQKDE
ncbi:MAG: YihY/virulence factor BrkB family protein [Anaerocolumna sp.]